MTSVAKMRKAAKGLCLAARFLCSVLISQGASFGLIIPTGINRTAAAVPASAASFAEQQCGLLDKAARSTERPGARKGQEHGKASPAPARSHQRGLGGLSPTPQHRGRASPGAGRALQSTMPCWPLHSGGANTRGEHAHSPQHRPQPDPRARFPVTCCFSSDKAPGEKLRLRFVRWLGAW